MLSFPQIGVDIDLEQIDIDIDMGTLGLVLIVVGVILLIVEMATPGFFIALPGSVFLLIGIMIYYVPWIWSTPWGIVIAVVVTICMSALVIGIYKQLGRGHKVLTPSVGTMAGKEALVMEDLVPGDLSGKVKVGTETWSATSDEPIPSGKEVVVVKGEGVHLIVKRVNKEKVKRVNKEKKKGDDK